MEYGHNDEKDQEQEADEEDDSLNGHSCKCIAKNFIRLVSSKVRPGSE